MKFNCDSLRVSVSLREAFFGSCGGAEMRRITGLWL
jgi:hypothetical protein